MIPILVTIVVVGLILYAINAWLPMDARVKQILNVVVIICLIIYLLQAFGLIGSLGSIGPK